MIKFSIGLVYFHKSTLSMSYSPTILFKLHNNCIVHWEPQTSKFFKYYGFCNSYLRNKLISYQNKSKTLQTMSKQHLRSLCQRKQNPNFVNLGTKLIICCGLKLFLSATQISQRQRETQAVGDSCQPRRELGINIFKCCLLGTFQCGRLLFN